jgi:hypothetical protein
MSSDSVSPHGPIRAGGATSRSFGRAANWTVGIAAAVLVLISVGGYWYHREQLAAIAAEHLRLIVTGPSVLQAGTDAAYIVSTTAISSQPLPAQIEVALLSPDGKRLMAYKEPADEHGRLQVVIPASLQIVAQLTLKVAARHRESREEAEIPLTVEPVRYATQLALDKSAYRPGETVYYRSLTLSRFGLTADRKLPIRFEILDPQGAVVPNSALNTVTDHGVAGGAFAVAEGLTDGRYTLVVRSPDRSFSDRKRSFLIGGNRSQPKAAPVEHGRVSVTFYPEGGQLAAGLENRVYFVAHDSLGKPVRLSGMIAAAGRDDGSDEDIALAQTTYEGMGVFSFTPQAGRTYRLRILNPAGIADEPKLPEATVERDVALTTGAGVFAAASPLEFNIRAAKPGLPLVVAAYCRGVQVGQQPLLTKSNGTGANPVAILLDGAVAGVIRLIVYDYSATPPKPVAERLVYRRPARKLNVRAAKLSQRYAPDEKVDLSLLVSNEKGEPTPATLSVAVVDAALLDPRAPAMPTYFLLTNEIQKSDDMANADFYLSDETRDKTPAAVALDLLLGTHRPAASDVVGHPPAMYDNAKQIRSNYEKTLASYQADRTKALNTLTTASFFGGLGLVVLVAMLGLMGIVSGMHLWVPAIGATTCCLIIGAILTDPGRLTTGRDAATPFASYHAPAVKAEKLAKPRSRSGSAPAAPTLPGGSAKTPLWTPLLITGPDGKAAIHFKLPAAKTTFRVTIDAHGDGRLGSASTEIVSDGGQRDSK